MEMTLSEISTIRDLVNLWPTRADLAADVRDAFPGLTVSVHQVHKWAEKQSIPARYHYPVFKAAEVRGFEVTAEKIAQMHSRPAERKGAA